MATNFPEDLDNLNNPESTDSMQGHAQLHADVNDAIEALQTKVGVDGSLDPNSLDYKVNDIVSIVSGLSGSTTALETILGIDGNNDLVIAGIENKTTIDSFSKNEFRSADYKIMIKRNADYYSSKISVLIDEININVSETDIVSNTSSDLATISFEENSGIIGLCVTPVGSAVTVRYYRTALKA